MAIYRLGAIQYKTKGAALKEVRRILHCTTPGRTLHGRDLQVICGLLDRHPDVDSKIEKGVVDIVVRSIEYRKGIRQNCFFVVHCDGTETDFSIHVALGRVSSGPTLAEAAREVVADDIHAFKVSAFAKVRRIVCPLSGELVGFAETHVDHAPPWTFKRILSVFQKRYEPVVKNHSDGLRVVFAEPEHADRFRKWHNSKARLRVVSAKANMAAGSHEHV